jgi:hypothetical protein
MKTENNDQDNCITLDLHEFEKGELIHLIMYAHKKDFTFNQAIADIVSNFLEDPIFLEDTKDLK